MSSMGNGADPPRRPNNNKDKHSGHNMPTVLGGRVSKKRQQTACKTVIPLCELPDIVETPLTTRPPRRNLATKAATYSK